MRIVVRTNCLIVHLVKKIKRRGNINSLNLLVTSDVVYVIFKPKRWKYTLKL